MMGEGRDYEQEMQIKVLQDKIFLLQFTKLSFLLQKGVYSMEIVEFIGDMTSFILNGMVGSSPKVDMMVQPP